MKNIAQQPAPTPLSEIRVPAPNPAETTSKAPDSEIDPLEAQLKYLKNQILESERNLKAHHDAMQETKGVTSFLWVPSFSTHYLEPGK